MKKHDCFDISMLLDDIFGAAENFRQTFKDEFKDFAFSDFFQASNRDFYSGHYYPPVNIYLTEDRTMVLQFALAGFNESDIHLEFKGDYLVISADAPVDFKPQQKVRYLKQCLKLKNVCDQHYFVPSDKYQQGKVSAIFRNSILTVSIPSQEKEQEGVKVHIHSTRDTTTKKSKEKSE